MTRRQPSLRRALLLNLLVPTSVLAAALGVAGSLLIYRTVETSYDRVLDGSVHAIAERITVDNNEVIVDLPQVALQMLGARAIDSVYYRVSYDGAPITGYDDLPLVAVETLSPGTVAYFDLIYRGQPIRAGALAQIVYGKPRPILVEVAETRNGRRATERGLLVALAALEAGIVLTAALLGRFAVIRGLEPLKQLKRQIDVRGIGTGTHLGPLSLAEIPSEALPPVQAMNMLFVRLESAIEIIRNFTADASHQMKTPLAALRVHLSLLQRMPSLETSGREAAAEIEKTVKHLDRLVGQLIAMARADEATIAEGTSEPPHVDLVAAAADAIDQLAPLAATRNVDLAFESDVKVAPVVASAATVHEILVNLIDNAIRYDRDGGSVTVRILSPTGRHAVEIVDTGPGIAPALRARVFDRFHRVPGANKPPGAGLGLAIAQTLTKQNNGTITLADGDDGIGLSIRVEFSRMSLTAET